MAALGLIILLCLGNLASSATINYVLNNSFTEGSQSGIQPGDYLGYFTSWSSQYIVMGVTGRNDYRGGAYVNNAALPGFPEITYLNVSGLNPYDQFGYFSAISGNTVAISAFNTSSGGKVYTYTCSSTGCNLQDFFAPEDLAGEYDGFGNNLDFLPNSILVSSAPQHPVNGNAAQGAVYLYNCSNPARCTPVSTLYGPNGVAGDTFGSWIAVDGSHLVVGASGRNNNTGAAYLYDCSTPSACVLQETLSPSDAETAPYSQFGSSVAISGNYVAVGAANKTVGQYISNGGVYVFYCPTLSTCTQISILNFPTMESYAGYGFNVAVTSTGWVASGASGYNVGSSYDVGIVALHQCTTTSCTWDQTFNSPTTDTDTYFGDQVLFIDGGLAIIADGAYVKGQEAIGIVYLYTPAITSSPSPSTSNAQGLFPSTSFLFVIILFVFALF